MIWLPAGEVFLAPVPGTASGKIIVDRQIFQGRPITNLELTFDEGRLTDMSAGSDADALRAYFDAAGPGKDVFSFVDVGINPNVKIPPGSDMMAWMASGMITVGCGGNLWAGGDNNCPFGMSHFLPGSTLEIDGKPIVKDGTLLASADQ